MTHLTKEFKATMQKCLIKGGRGRIEERREEGNHAVMECRHSVLHHSVNIKEKHYRTHPEPQDTSDVNWLLQISQMSAGKSTNP